MLSDLILYTTSNYINSKLHSKKICDCMVLPVLYMHNNYYYFIIGLYGDGGRYMMMVTCLSIIIIVITFRRHSML